MTIASLPTSPSRTSPLTIASRTQAFFEALRTFTTEANTDTASLASSTASVATNYNTVLGNEALGASYEAGSDDVVNSLSFGGPANLWVSGTSYTVGANVKSPSTGLTYKRRTNGAGTTDPSADSTNWGLISQVIETSLPSAYPSLVLNFLNEGPIDPRITFTRASSATRVDPDGNIVLVGSNVPRIDYDPSTGVCKGLLIEESRTNLLLNSLINGTNLSTQTVSVSAVAYTISFYGSGTIVLSGVSSATVTGTGDYPARTTLTFTPTAGSLVCTVSGDVKYAQLEAGSFATSFIPTAGSSATRAADLASMTGTNFSSWYRSDEGTLVVEYDVIATNPSGFNRIVSVNNSTSSNEITLLLLPSLYKAYAVTVSGGVTQYDTSGTTNGNILLVKDTKVKAALSFKANDFGCSFSGNPVEQDSSGTIPSVTRMDIGNIVGVNAISGHIARFAFYPKRLTNAENVALSTW